MPTENKVFTKLFSDKKVELNVINEIKTLGQELKQITEDYEEQIRSVQNEIDILQRMIPGTTQQSVDLRVKMEDFRELAYDLGISSSNVSDTLKEYEEILEDYYVVSDKVDSLVPIAII